MEGQVIKNRKIDLSFNKYSLIELSPELQKKAEEELNEYPSRKMKDIEEFREMVLNEPGLNANTSDTFLLRFLRARKFDKTRALKLLKNYYKIKKNLKIVFDDTLVPSNVMEVFEEGILSVLPQRDPEGRVILFIQIRKWKPAQVNLESMLRAVFLLVEKILQDESVQIVGFAVILDLETLWLNHIRAFRPTLAYNLIMFIQECLPARLKAVHLVRENMFLDVGYAVVKPFLKPKLKKRLLFHGHDMKNLFKCIPRERLPKEVDGTQGPHDVTEWCQIMRDSEQEFVEDLAYGYKEES